VLEGGVPAAVGVTAPGGVALAALAGPLRRGDEVVGAGVVVVERDRLPRPRPEDAPDDPLLALGRLAAGAAHEIRNPLTAIQGFLQLLERECRSPASGRYLQIIRQEMRRIEGIAADLLLLSRPAETPAVPCALPELLQRTGELLAERAAASGVRIELEAPVSVPPVAAVPERLQQVFLNLLGNAIEAMPRGGAVRVRVSGGPPGPGDCVEVAVEDEGPGVPPDVLPRLFEPFFTTKAGGTGLGLAVSQSIVRTFGGDIAVESPPGGGAVFTVRLPAARARPGAGRFHPGRLPAG
jgi:signal transduction histidine kinase